MAHLRLARPDDAPAIRRIYAPSATESAVSFEETAPTEAEVRDRIETTTERYPWLVCVDDEVVGYAYAGRHRKRSAYRWSVDVSVYVAERARRAGVATGLYTALFDVLRTQGYVNAHAGTKLPNPGSVGLHAAVGFEPVGTYEGVGYKRGAWHDVRRWAKRLRERPDDPEEPSAVDAVRGTAAWSEALENGASRVSL